MEWQRDPLDEQFDELFKDVSTAELLEKIDMELATDGDAAACDDSDADVLVVEYVSDDENLAPADKVNADNEDDSEYDHVLKASDVVWCLWLPTVSQRHRFWDVCLSHLSVRSSGQIVSPRYFMNDLSSLDETYIDFTGPYWWPD